ncbi:DUF2975 domain-containing protein [Photobacterium sp. J15]|uniref:DUF2975 domain-containing protein n=1 Tax=Photobacterium sp. J15 TaxID=265901 RepID=UPI0007E37B42|nr:DUF2975 domain-containing protein [Photobacterium sp. J15]
MHHQQAIEKLSKRLLILLWAIFITTPVFISFLWFYGTLVESGDMVNLEFSYPVALPFTPTKAFMGYPFALAPSLVYMAIIWQLIRLFRLYRAGLVFTPCNVSCLKITANLMIASPFISAISDLLLGAVLSIGEEELNTGLYFSDTELTIFIIGLMVRAISHVMALAKDMKEEHELTI